MLQITTRHEASQHGVPVVTFNGHDVPQARGISLVLEYIGWSLSDLAEATGKSLSTCKKIGSGHRPAPAEVLNVLKDRLELG